MKQTQTKLGYIGRRITIILAGAILLFGVLPVSCAKVHLDDSTKNEGLLTAIKINLHGSIIMIELSVDDSAPLDFIFDTGAGGTIINKRTAVELGIAGDETVSREGGTGMASIVLSTKHNLSTGELRFENVTLGITDLSHIEKRLGLPIDGVIGWEILSRYAVRVNYESMHVEIYDNKRFDYDLSAEGFSIDVQGTVIFVNVTVTLENGNTFTGKVMVDTGSGGTLSFNTPFTEENALLEETENYYKREIKSLSTDSALVYTTMLKNLTINNCEFAEVPANISFAESGALSWPGIMGILGNEVLKRFNIFINLQEQIISLEPNQLYDEEFEINCFGVELVVDETLQKVIVDQIYVGSPAHEAGLEVGDEIVQIDGISASNYLLPQIRSIFSQEGKNVEITIDRKGELHNYNITLQLPKE